MYLVEMDKVQDYAVEKEYSYNETLSGVGPGNIIMFPRGDLNSISYYLSGDASLRVTSASRSTLILALANDAIDDLHWVSVGDQSIINKAVTAINQINLSGVTSLSVGAQ